MPASRLTAAVADPAVSQADNITTSASSLRSKISRKLSSPSDPSGAKLVTSAGRGGQSGRGRRVQRVAAARADPRPFPRHDPGKRRDQDVEIRMTQEYLDHHQRQQDGRREDTFLKIGEVAETIRGWAISRLRHIAASGRRTP